MANSACCLGHMLRRQDGHILKRAIEFDIEGQRTWKRQVEEGVMVGSRREDALCRSKWRLLLG